MKVSGIPYIQAKYAYTDGDGLKFGIAIHATANTATARQEAAYMQTRTDGISCHLVVDDREIIQSLDTVSKAGHAGSSEGNGNAIAVECVGLIAWSRQRWLDSIVWDQLAAALAQVIRTHWPDGSFAVRRASVAEMKANPKVKAFYAHDDMRLAWGGTTHTDPGPGFPWDRLFAAVNSALGGDDDMTKDELLAFIKTQPIGWTSAGQTARMVERKWSKEGPTVQSALTYTLENTYTLIDKVAELRALIEAGGSDVLVVKKLDELQAAVAALPVAVTNEHAQRLVA